MGLQEAAPTLRGPLGSYCILVGTGVEGEERARTTAGADIAHWPLSVFILVAWAAWSVCCFHWKTMGRERERKRRRDKRPADTCKAKHLSHFFPLPKGMTSTNYFSTFLPLASRVLKNHWAEFSTVIQYLPQGL